MKVLIHALGATMGGAVRHLTSFLPQLGQQDVGREYVVLVRESFPAPAVTGNIVFERVPDSICSAWAKRIAADVFELPRRLKKDNFSAIVSLTNFGPIWSPVPHIFFQRNALYYCPYYLERIGGRLKVETKLRRRLAIESMQRADMIVTPSNAMGSMIRESCPQLSSSRFFTLYHGFANEDLADPLEKSFVEMLSSRSGIKILFPAHAAIHKGLDILCHILAHLKADGLDCCLFATFAREDWPEGVEAFERSIREIGMTENVVLMGRVPQRQMGAIYAQCDLMLYTSLCESFGFSMIEAMGYELPVVAADTEINREMCKDAALYYPPFDAAAGAMAVKKALMMDVAQHMRDAGNRRLVSFDWSWQRYAREFTKMIGAVA